MVPTLRQRATPSCELQHASADEEDIREAVPGREPIPTGQPITYGEALDQTALGHRHPRGSAVSDDDVIVKVQVEQCARIAKLSRQPEVLA